MRVNIRSRWAAAALGFGLLPGACSLPPLPSPSGFFEAFNHPKRTLKDTVRLLERKSGGERRKALETILRDLGVRYEVQRYPAGPDAAGPGEGANLFFDLGGGAKTLIVSAHHDAVPGSPGANDDASCVSAILDAYARLRRTPPANLKVRFIFFDGEEIGLKGSKEYVRAHDLKNILAMFSLELCGIGDAAAVWESEETERKTPAIRALLETLEENNVAHLVEGDIPKFGSDHESFRKAGIPALALSIFPKKEESILREFIFNPGSPKWADRGRRPSIFRHYHTPNDTAGRLREDAMALMSEIIHRTVLRLDRTLKKIKADRFGTRRKFAYPATANSSEPHGFFDRLSPLSPPPPLPLGRFALQDHAGQGQVPGVGQAQVRAAHPQGVGHITGDAREPQRRGAALFPEDLYVFPGDPARPPHAQGLQGRLLRREADRKVLIGTSFRLAVGPLSRREDAAVEPLAVPLAGLGHPLDFQQVGPDPQNHHASSPPCWAGRDVLGPKTSGPKTR